jgi:hypothetical protein
MYVLIQELTVEDAIWPTLLQTVAHDFYHLPSHTCLEAQRLRGRPVGYLVHTHEASWNCWLFIPAIVRPIFSSNAFDLTNAYGYPCPLWSQDALQIPGFDQRAITAWVEYLRTAGIVSAFLRFHPLFPQPETAWQQHGLLLNQGATVSIDLTLPTEQLWRQTRQGHRYEIKKMQKCKDITVFMDDDWSYFEAFMECYTATMDKVRASPQYYFTREFLMALREGLGKQLHLCVVCIKGAVASAGLFTEMHGIVQFHLSGTQPELAYIPTSKLMLHYVRDWAKQRGNRVFHLGGGVGARHDGLFLFKAGFSPLRHPFYTWRAVVNADAYRSLVEERRHVAGSLSSADLKLDGFFPEYRMQLL